MGLTNVSRGYAEQRIAALDAQIKDHEGSIERLKAKRAQFADAEKVDSDFEATPPKPKRTRGAAADDTTTV